MNLTVFKYALTRGMRNPLSLAVNCALPILLVMIAPLWAVEEGGHATGFYLMAMALMFGAFVASKGIMNDRMDGTITRILAGPVTSFSYLAQNLLACMVPMAAQVAAVIIIGAARYNWPAGLALGLALCYTIFAAASVAFSFAWSCMFKNKEVSYAVFSVVMSLIGMLGGFWIPLYLLPDIMRYFGALFPAYWASNAIETLLAYGAAPEYWLSVAAIFLFGTAYLLYGGKRRII